MLKYAEPFLQKNKKIVVGLCFQSYTLRNGVLGMMGEILVHVLSKEGLDNHQKAARDGLFDRLQVISHLYHMLNLS
jgi:condensin complex subunit 1